MNENFSNNIEENDSFKLYLSNFKFVNQKSGRVNLRFSLTWLINTPQGPFGQTQEGCVAYLNKSGTLCWHTLFHKFGNGFKGYVFNTKPLYEKVLYALAQLKHTKKLKLPFTQTMENSLGQDFLISDTESLEIFIK
jgi:hypothetical protein